MRAKLIADSAFLPSETNTNSTQTPSSRGDRSTSQAPYSPFNIVYYQVRYDIQWLPRVLVDSLQSYFDVDTNTVLKRVAMSMLPRAGFATDVCEGSVDLYGECADTKDINSYPGPFWTLTTLILVLYTTSTLTSSITRYLSDPKQHITTNLPLLSTALSTVYIYGLGVPVLLWAAIKWLGIGQWSLVEALGLYGYGMSVFIPVSLLCLIPVGILRWVLVGAGAASSGSFL